MSVFKGSPLGELARVRRVTTRRVSSYDRTGEMMTVCTFNQG
jgi:hypothetical protein